MRAATIDDCRWPASRLGEAMGLVARIHGRAPESIAPHDDANFDQWLESAAAARGWEVEPVETCYPEFARFLCNAAPALLRLPHVGGAHFLVLTQSSARRVSLLGTDHLVRAFSSEIVRDALCHAIEAPALGEVERLLAATRTSGPPRARARAAILREQLRAERLTGCWLLRLAPGANFWQHARQARLPRRLAALVAAHTAQYLLWLLAWWILGRAAFAGRFDPAWFAAWALLLFCLVPFRLFVTWSQGRLAIGAGALLKQRLLHGALRLEPEEIRQQGVGQLLGRVMEAEAVESLALSGGVLGLMAGIELLVAGFVLRTGSGGWLHAALLAAWVLLTLGIAWSYYQRRERWTAHRLGMTNDLVERMVGHRTRLAQQPREHWHDGEDESVEGYQASATAMDRRGALLTTLSARGWIVLGLLGLAPAFVSASGSPVALAVGIGGILLAFRALQNLAQGLSHLAGAALAWKQIAPLFHAAARIEPRGALVAVDAKATTLLAAHDVTFRHHDRAEPILRGCHLRIRAGDRLLLEGPSGAGKSTLASLLTGLRRPESGLLLLHGLDAQTTGAALWRRHAAAAPQFHENHVLSATFAFNLLMGRRWPPRAGDFEEAEKLCEELGLGELLRRMPGGLLQMVGETGWQLSHGEKSRLYLARALLQGADLVVLDESFASLDPENLRVALRCALHRAPTLLAIAHP